MNSQKKQITTVDDYIQSFPKPLQATLEELREVIKEQIPNAKETISYKMPAYKSDGKFIVYFGAWKHHISLYPFSKEMNDVIAGLSDYKTSGKGTIQFPADKPLPLEKIREIVDFLLKSQHSHPRD